MAGPTKAAERRAREREAADETTSPPSGAPRPRSRLTVPGRRALLILSALGLVLGAFGIWALYGSSWLRVEKVSVEGTRVLTERRVRDAAGVPPGAPLASVDTSAVERRVREELRRVAEVRVVRAWPHGVGVQVTERRPVLVMRDAGGGGGSGGSVRYVEVDAAGVRFATVDTAPEGVPLLVVEPGRDTASRRRFGPVTLRRGAADVVAALPPRVRGDARTVRMASYDSVTVELSGGRTVRWGSPERGAAKAEALGAVMRAAEDASHFDVSAPGAPAVSATG